MSNHDAPIDTLDAMEIGTQKSFQSCHLVAVRRDVDSFDIGTTEDPQSFVRRGLSLAEAAAYIAKGPNT